MEIAIQKVPVGNVSGWFKYGWGIFTRAWLMWIISLICIGICFFVFYVILSLIPFIGQIATGALGAVYGLITVFIVRNIEQTGSINLGSVIENLKAKSQPLLIFMGIGAGFSLLSVALVYLMVGSGAAVGSMSGGDGMQIAGGLMGATFGGIISLTLWLIYAMGAFFAFPLIAATDVDAIDAFKASFKASIVNFIPCLVYGLVIFVLSFGVILTLGFGLLILCPVLVAANYQAAKDMFPAIK